MSRKSGLGRGLDALFPRGESEQPSGNIRYIPIESIVPNPRQPRTNFDAQELNELSASIRQHGILQPLLVTRGSNPTEYFLVAGERRLIAARQAGLDTVPAIVRSADEQQRLELALIENLQRTNLSPLEAADAYRQLAEDFGLSHAEIADQVGKSRAAVTNTLRLLKLPLVVQQTLGKGQIHEGHARALLALSSTQAQSAALQTILTRGLSVRQTEALVRKMSGQRPTPKPTTPQPPELDALEETLRERLGTRVQLVRRSNGGKIILHYYSDEELNALVDRILGENG